MPIPWDVDLCVTRKPGGATVPCKWLPLNHHEEEYFPSTTAHDFQHSCPASEGKVEFILHATHFVQLVRHGLSAGLVAMLWCYVVPETVCRNTMVAEYVRLSLEGLHFLDDRRCVGL